MWTSRRRARWAALLVALGVSTAALAAEPTSAAEGPAPQFLTRLGSLVFFALYDERAGGWQVWRTDTTPTGTFSVATGLGADAAAAGATSRSTSRPRVVSTYASPPAVSAAGASPSVERSLPTAAPPDVSAGGSRRDTRRHRTSVCRNDGG
jgi:hypothetical protein